MNIHFDKFVLCNTFYPDAKIILKDQYCTYDTGDVDLLNAGVRYNMDSSSLFAITEGK